MSSLAGRPRGEYDVLEHLRRSTPDGQTVSVGSAEPDPGEPASALLRRGDLALYNAQTRGKDRVVVAA